MNQVCGMLLPKQNQIRISKYMNMVNVLHREPNVGDAFFEEASKIIEEKGAVIIRGLINQEEAGILKENLARSIKEDEDKRGRDYLFYGMVHALMTRGQCFIDLLEDEGITKTVRNVLGHGAIVYAYNSSSMPTSDTNFSRTIHVDSPRLIPNYLTNVAVTIALDPFTSENGAMEILPLSFNKSEMPSEIEFEQNAVKLDNLEIGDAIIFNARCCHRGGINKTDEWRHAVTMNICRSYMRQQFNYPKMFSKEQESEFSENVKQFLGYYVRSPKSLDEFLLPPNERPYRPGQE